MLCLYPLRSKYPYKCRICIRCELRMHTNALRMCVGSAILGILGVGSAILGILGDSRSIRKVMQIRILGIRLHPRPFRPVYAYERATYGLRESNFTIFTCNCCTDSARSTYVPRTVLASSVLPPHFPVDLLNDHAEHTCTIPVYKDDLTGDCQLVSKMHRKALEDYQTTPKETGRGRHQGG
ncbi:hypothetical protein Bbelb_024830 [Branchiostoma belcheri]|nr:hypothetical protein Bbelb_024830 [Branchiostoma belcheri]